MGLSMYFPIRTFIPSKVIENWPMDDVGKEKLLANNNIARLVDDTGDYTVVLVGEINTLYVGWTEEIWENVDTLFTHPPLNTEEMEDKFVEAGWEVIRLVNDMKIEVAAKINDVYIGFGAYLQKGHFRCQSVEEGNNTEITLPLDCITEVPSPKHVARLLARTINLQSVGYSLIKVEDNLASLLRSEGLRGLD